MEKVITNTTAIIFLRKIRRLDLLDIFRSIETTREVQEELLEAKDIPYEEKELLKEFFQRKITVREGKRKLKLNLGKGEESAINLCVENKINYFLSDDKKARKTAEIFSIKCIGCIGIILENLQKRKIQKKEAKELLQLLIKNSYYISIELYDNITKEIEEYDDK